MDKKCVICCRESAFLLELSRKAMVNYTGIYEIENRTIFDTYSGICTSCLFHVNLLQEFVQKLPDTKQQISLKGCIGCGTNNQRFLSSLPVYTNKLRAADHIFSGIIDSEAKCCHFCFYKIEKYIEYNDMFQSLHNSKNYRLKADSNGSVASPLREKSQNLLNCDVHVDVNVSQGEPMVPKKMLSEHTQQPTVVKKLLKRRSTARLSVYQEQPMMHLKVILTRCDSHLLFPNTESSTMKKAAQSLPPVSPKTKKRRVSVRQQDALIHPSSQASFDSRETIDAKHQRMTRQRRASVYPVAATSAGLMTYAPQSLVPQRRRSVRIQRRDTVDVRSSAFNSCYTWYADDDDDDV